MSDKPKRKTLKLRLVKGGDRRKHQRMLDDGWVVETEAPWSWGVGGKIITYRRDR